jgi:hypothetical protein
MAQFVKDKRAHRSLILPKHLKRLGMLVSDPAILNVAAACRRWPDPTFGGPSLRLPEGFEGLSCTGSHRNRSACRRRLAMADKQKTVASIHPGYIFPSKAEAFPPTHRLQGLRLALFCRFA